MKVAVVVSDEIGSRCASALLSHPAVDLVGLVDADPPRSWGSRAVRTADGEGFDVVVGGDAASLAPDALLVVPGPAPGGRPAVTHASPEGLARCLAAGLAAPAVVAVTGRGSPAREGTPVAFPAPLGWVYATEVDGLLVAPVDGTLAAVAASDRSRIRAVVDDRLFLEGVCLAAGALVADTTGPVWSRPDAYLRAAEDLGLVVAESLTS